MVRENTYAHFFSLNHKVKVHTIDLIPKMIFQASTSRAGKSINDEAVFIKKFPRYEDVFCLGVEERSRSLKMDNALPINMTDTIGGNNLENFQRSEFGLIMLKKYLLI